MSCGINDRTIAINTAEGIAVSTIAKYRNPNQPTVAAPIKYIFLLPISFGCFLMTSTIGAFLDPVVAQQLAEHRCLEDAEPNPQANSNQDDRQRERDTPAPGGELIAGPSAEGQYHKVREKQTGRDSELRP